MRSPLSLKVLVVVATLLGVQCCAWSQLPPVPPDDNPKLPREADYALRVEITWIWGLPGITLRTAERTPDWNEYSFSHEGDSKDFMGLILSKLSERKWDIKENEGEDAGDFYAQKRDMGLNLSYDKSNPDEGQILTVEIGKGLKPRED